MRIPDTSPWKNKSKRPKRWHRSHMFAREDHRLNHLHWRIGQITTAGKFSLHHGALYWAFLAVVRRSDLTSSWESLKRENAFRGERPDPKCCLSERSLIRLFMWARRQWLTLFTEQERQDIYRRDFLREVA